MMSDAIFVRYLLFKLVSRWSAIRITYVQWKLRKHFHSLTAKRFNDPSLRATILHFGLWLKQF